MKISGRKILASVVGLGLAFCTLTNANASPAFSMLVFSKTLLYRHASITNGVTTMKKLAGENDFAVDATEDSSVFTAENLNRYKVVVFLSTSGDILNDEQQAAFKNFVENGGGFVGIHAAAFGKPATEGSWPWYGQMFCTEFVNHKAIERATVRVEDRTNASTAHLPERWSRTDEWYNYTVSPRGKVHVIASLDEKSFHGGTMGDDHPVAWCRQVGKGRFWYTALGHTAASYSEPEFVQHMLGGIQIAAGLKPVDFAANCDPHFRKVVIDETPHDPMEIAVAKDGRVFYVERLGFLKRCLPETKESKVIAKLSVFDTPDNGLLGITLDPGFLANGWIYLCYSPPGVSENRVARFTLKDDALDFASEKILVHIRVQREQPICHTGGSLAFDSQGNLYISTGDNVNPFASDGFSPSDERPGRAPWDAQGTSANANDLRGKVLRVHPEADGSITIPKGNLFPADGTKGRPEIYTMGCRNPFRISVDARTSFLYWGDVGPDAQSAKTDRGPAGFDEVNQARAAGNFGWPYFVGDNKPYRRFDFEAKTCGAEYDAAKPVNDSPNNTGPHELPPAHPAFIAYPYSPSTKFPAVGSGGRTAMAGPVYYYDPGLNSRYKLPQTFDHTLFVYDWSRDWINAVKLDSQGQFAGMQRFLPGMNIKRPMDLELGPDGALYLLEWGTQYNGNNADAQIVRIEYEAGRPAELRASN
jgi:cytochrome c